MDWQKREVVLKRLAEIEHLHELARIAAGFEPESSGYANMTADEAQDQLMHGLADISTL